MQIRWQVTQVTKQKAYEKKSPTPTKLQTKPGQNTSQPNKQSQQLW
jgi:hypothetical protein